MGSLSRFEELAEGLIEGTFARLLRTRLHPIEVAKRLARAMEEGQFVDPRGRLVVPNVYWVYLNPDDLAAMQSYREILEQELAHYIIELAQKTNSTLTAPPTVHLREDDRVLPRRVNVKAEVLTPNTTEISLERTQSVPRATTSPPPTIAPRFVLIYGNRRIPISEPVLNIGRSLDNDIILDDKRVSRRHAQLRRRYGQYILYDLDSTGGTMVNGQPIRETVLRPGDVIHFAGVEVRFEASHPEEL